MNYVLEGAKIIQSKNLLIANTGAQVIFSITIYHRCQNEGLF